MHIKRRGRAALSVPIAELPGGFLCSVARQTLQLPVNEAATAEASGRGTLAQMPRDELLSGACPGMCRCELLRRHRLPAVVRRLRSRWRQLQRAQRGSEGIGRCPHSPP